MINIRVFSSFCSSEECMSDFIRIHHLMRDEDYGKTYQFVCDDSYTHVIILNIAMPNLTIPKDNVIGFAFEPPVFLGLTHKFVNYARQNIKLYCIGDNYGLPEPFAERFAFQHHRPQEDIIPYDQRKFMSIMISEKKTAPGHKYRHDLVEAILRTTLPIDIYGRGCIYYSGDTRIKGKFGDDYKMYHDYKYHICIENYQLPAYVSEKVTSTLAYNTIPIYLGSPLLDDYVLKLTGNITTDICMLQTLCTTYSKPSKTSNQFFTKYDLSLFIKEQFH
jgi:hypothetical protein